MTPAMLIVLTDVVVLDDCLPLAGIGKRKLWIVVSPQRYRVLTAELPRSRTVIVKLPRFTKIL